VSFEVAPTAYDQFMGRFASPLAAQFADHIGVHAGQMALDVGCGPEAFTEVLAARLGPSAVAAVDPSQSFVAAIRERQPEVDVRAGSAEALPFPDSTFDVAAAQLVVHFMSDPVAGKAHCHTADEDLLRLVGAVHVRGRTRRSIRRITRPSKAKRPS
jgi:ubiquinone/menaquinone biosynthesis C-methylase UbiE